MADVKLEVSMRKLLDKKEQPFFMANCEMDVSLKDTVLLAFPSSDKEVAKVEEQFARMIDGLRDIPDDNRREEIRTMLRSFYNERLSSLRLVIEQHDDSRRKEGSVLTE